ncbi:ALBINO3-like protein 2, chloroplastic isoform X1 [Camellia sinensis]|uniref:ALBINO3-like protein 2, chloroplastic isoform X1 n=1 Tax=Camellia sinensis TaxID=4442 RepID=UPI001036541A|nr:ALBINO3-like protein 2, chloroplastic isoform X1 [Camellia sinensis]
MPAMATPKLLLSKLLRRRSSPTLSSLISSSSSSSSHTCSHSNLFDQSHNLTSPKRFLPLPPSTLHSLSPHYNFLCFRFLSTRDSEFGPSLDSDNQSDEFSSLGFAGGGGGGGVDDDGLDVAEALVSASASAGDSSVAESILPVRAVVSLLDYCHDFTGLPWWVIIASSTLVLRITLLPMLILQLKKLKKIAELFPKLPPPLPPPLSGRSYIDQLSLFRKEKRSVGCPSYLWFLAYFSVQVPCFFLWMTSIRRMSLDHHPGFDCGGILWFENLTEFPHGVLGAIFPLLIATLHFANVQVSFRTSSVGKVTGLFGLLAQYYKLYLEILTLPLMLIGFCVPQGSLVYWLTNSSLTLIQQLSLNHPGVREKLGLPDKAAPVPTANCEEMDTPGEMQPDLLRKERKIRVHNLSAQELLALSVQLLAKGHKDRAIPLLRLALEKDPNYVQGLVVMGQTLLQSGQLAEATEYLERAISKLFLIGHPTEVEEVDLLILASQWAGIAYIRQERCAEGIKHLERVANLKEPEDSKSKAHYYDAFILLARGSIGLFSALYKEGRKAEAAKYLRIAVVYDSAYNVYLEQCEKDDDEFVGDLVSSRRRDY